MRELSSTDRIKILKLWGAKSRINEHFLNDWAWVNFDDLTMLMQIVNDCLDKYNLDFKLYTDDGYWFAQFTKRNSDEDVGHSMIGQNNPTDAILLSLLTLAEFKNIKE